MSKEEILEKYHTHQAMDVYAKEVAIGYDKWKIESGYRWDREDKKWKSTRQRNAAIADFAELTHEQLYQQYLNQKNERTINNT